MSKPVYHLEHSRYPRVYRFEVGPSEVVVERWEGPSRVSVRNLSIPDARRLYGYLRSRAGYREFGFSTVLND